MQYDKKALNFAIRTFSTSLHFSKRLNFLKFLPKLQQTIFLKLFILEVKMTRRYKMERTSKTRSLSTHPVYMFVCCYYNIHVLVNMYID